MAALEQMLFSKPELLTNLSIKKSSSGNAYPFNVTLVNSAVRILLIIESPTEITLYGYHKSHRESRKGVARCAFYFLLTELLSKKQITNEQIVHVSSPTPDDGNLRRLIKIYEEMGFTLGEPQPGNPTNLNASIETLISTLKQQCNSDIEEPFMKPNEKNVKRTLLIGEEILAKDCHLYEKTYCWRTKNEGHLLGHLHMSSLSTTIFSRGIYLNSKDNDVIIRVTCPSELKSKLDDDTVYMSLQESILFDAEELKKETNGGKKSKRKKKKNYKRFTKRKY